MSQMNFRGAGSLDAALANGRHLLAADPLGAAAQAQEILRSNPVNGDALRLLGAAFRRLDRNRQAEQAELAAISASSHNPVLVAAAAAITESRWKDAEHLLRPYLATTPDDAAAINMLARIAVEMDAFDEAEALVRQALLLAPRFAAAQLRLADLLFRQNRQDDGLAVLDALLEHDPDHFRANVSKAAALARIGEYDQAIAIYEGLLRRSPDKPQIWMSYGHVLKTRGRLQEGIDAYRQAIAIDPTYGEVWWSLANLKTVTLGEDDVATMMSALKQDDLDDKKRLHLHFALGKAFEDDGRIEESFHHYQAGNRIRRDMVPHDPDALEAEVDRARALFTPAFFAAHAGQGTPASDPIFIIGMPRAGSTLIEQILSSHSLVEGTSELPYVPVIGREQLAERAGTAEVGFPEMLASLAPSAIRSLGDEYLRRAQLHRKTSRPYFVDKLPNNWLDIGFIHLILPNARIIDARRHPLACCFSNFKQHFARGQGFTYSLEYLGRYYRDYVRLLQHFDTAIPGRVHRVLHERLVENPEAEIRRLLEYLELPFEESCLFFYRNERAVRTPSSEQVRRPINTEGLDRWKAYDRWLDPLKDALGPILEAYQ